MRAKVLIVAALVGVAPVALIGGSASAKSPPPPPPRPAPAPPKPAPAPPKPAPAPPKPTPPAPKPVPPPPPPVDPVQQQINKNGMPSFQDRHGAVTVTQIEPTQVPKGGIGVWPGSPTQRKFYSKTAVYPKCWTVQGAWSGPDDWSGYAHLNGWLTWCSNGFWITYAAGGEYPTNGGWYTVTYHNGAYWSGGCVGCQTIQMRDYMLWSWSSQPLGFLNNTGTTWLTQNANYLGIYSN